MKHAHGSISITTEATIKVLGRARIPGGRRFRLEVRSGDERGETGRWMKVHRVIDRDLDEYEEEVRDAETGELIHYCHERLSEHRDHGSAKPPPPPSS
jgi:hypothetical protein